MYKPTFVHICTKVIWTLRPTSFSFLTKNASHTLLPRAQLHIRNPPTRSAEGFCMRDPYCFCAQNTFLILCIRVRRSIGQRASVKAQKSCALAPSTHRHQDVDACGRTHDTCACTCGSVRVRVLLVSCLCLLLLPCHCLSAIELVWFSFFCQMSLSKNMDSWRIWVSRKS
jgi:hypothetical protein